MRIVEKTNPPMVEPEPIAIVGMGCRWPGDVNNTSQLWDLLRERRDGWTEFTPDRINIDGFYHPNGQRLGSMHHKGGHLLKNDPHQFDHTFFGLSVTEVMSMDPSQRKLLEVTYDAFDNAGQTLEQLSGSRTGVYLGNFNNDHLGMQIQDLDHTIPYVGTGGGPTILSNRINYIFNLKGPSSVIDTGCSASLYALHAAVLSLRNGDCDAAIVAGSNIILGPAAHIIGSKMGTLSPTSRCHTFDVSADGYSRADGFGALYVKRLSDALANNDPIRALVRGTSINANGKTNGISHPSPDGQEAVIRQAYKNAGLDPNLTGYFECHGTGTPVGDPIEISAIGRVFASGRPANEPLLIGSVKPNLGHSEAASAMSQIMKAILAMEKGLIPPTIGIETLNPAIDFDGARVKVVTDMTPWPQNKLKRTSVNSFGYGGANAHCILDHPSTVIDLSHQSLNGVTGHSSKESLTDGLTNSTNGHADGLTNGGRVHVDSHVRPLILLPISAHNDEALKSNIGVLSASIGDFDLINVLYTLAARKSRFSRRAFAVAEPAAVKQGLDASSMTFGKAPNSSARQIAFVFTGQGAQWPEMGSKLFHEYAVFRRSIQYMDKVLSTLHQAPEWTLESLLLEAAATSRIHQPEVSQTLCTAIQVALVDLLRQWGIVPMATVGHSSGEIGAAYAAGLLRAGEAIVIAYCRGRSVVTNKRKGLMIAVGLGPDTVMPYLEGLHDDIKVAAVNSPGSITLSGEPEAIQTLHATFDKAMVFNRILETGNNAYHSHHMLALGRGYEELATRSLDEVKDLISSKPAFPPITMVSSVTPQKGSPDVTPSYWRKNLESPVLFSQAVEKLVRDTSIDLMIEIGPHPALCGPLKQIRAGLKEKEVNLPACLASLRRGEHDVVAILNLVGNLFLHNAPVDLVAVNATEEVRNETILLHHGSHCIDMPQYQFAYQEKPIYFEGRFNREYRTRKKQRHDLLGARMPGTSKSHPSWRNVIRIKDLHWLEDHKLSGRPVFPAAAYFAMAIEAARELHNDDADSPPAMAFKLRQVNIHAALPLVDDDLGVETVLSMEKIVLTSTNLESDWYKFSISSTVPNSDVWTENCDGTITTESVSISVDNDRRLHGNPRSRALSMKRWYDKFAAMGLQYGPTFQALSNLRAYRRDNTALADVDLYPTRGNVKGGESDYLLHPAALDTCLQLALIGTYAGQVENVKKAFVPVAVDEMTVWVPQSCGETAVGLGGGRLLGQRSLYAKAQLYSRSGAPLLDIQEIKCTLYDGAAAVPDKIPREPYWRTVWRPDIDMLSNDDAKALSPPLSLHQSKLDAIENFIASSLAHIKPQLFKEFHSKAQDHDAFPALVPSVSDAAESIPGSVDRLQDVPEVKCVKPLVDSLEEIMTGKHSSLELPVQNQILHDLRSAGLLVQGGHHQLSFLVDLLAHKNPRMNILELEAGTGGGTQSVLDVLRSDSLFKRFNHYTVTDSRHKFVAELEIQFEGHTGLSFKRLKIEEDLASQEIELYSFDLIIAADVIGQLDHSENTLKNIHNLLKPEGKLAILQITRPRLYSDFFARALTGKWAKTRLFRSESEWAQALRQCGLSGVDISLPDYTGDEAISTVMLSSAPLLERPNVSNTRPITDEIYLLHGFSLPPVLDEIKLALAARGYNPTMTNVFDGQIPKGASVISLVDIGNVALLHCEEPGFKSIQSAIDHASTLVWVAGHAAAEAQSEPSAMKGILRAVAFERMDTKIAFVELTSDDGGSTRRDAELILAKYFQLESSISGKPFEKDTLVRDGMLCVERLVPDESLNRQFGLLHGFEGEIRSSPVGTLGPIRASYSQPGRLSTLHFHPDTVFNETLKADYVEIKTEAIGLNMKDIAVATGKFDHPYLNCEAAGVVTQVGSAVSSLKVGDKVFGLVWGNMGNYMRSPASMVLRTPDKASSVDAASMTIAYLTTLYAFNNVARLSRGESVLIQYATGGLGMAAIRLAQNIGAEIYATAGSPEKRELLTKTFGIPPSRIFDSRSKMSADSIMRATGRKGIDVILCSSAGEMMNDTFRCIAPLGRFVEVGRVNVIGNGKLALEVFKRNATFSSFDISLIYYQRPELYRGLLSELKELWMGGAIGPLPIITAFDISELESAMAYFSKGLHTGKVVITYQRPEALVMVKQVAPPASFHPDAAYILVGALGGLGHSLAAWMVERGAKRLVFVSRSGLDKPEAKQLVKDLEELGAAPEVVRCSVLDCKKLTQEIQKVSCRYSIKGVIHAAMVEGDIGFFKASFSQFNSVLDPKVTGTLNLHHATKHLPLDFFLMTSSIAGLVGSAAQAAYVAANAFQDAFARFRLSQNLPATALQLGLILEIGATVNSAGLQQSFQRSMTYGISETEFLQLVEGVLAQPNGAAASTEKRILEVDPGSVAQIATGFEPARYIHTVQDGRLDDLMWSDNPRFAGVVQAIIDRAQAQHVSNPTAVGGASSIAKQLKTASTRTEKEEIGRTAFISRLAELFGIPAADIDTDRPIAHYGLDSMVTTELRSWLVKTFDVDINPLRLLSKSITIDAIVKILVSKS